MKRTLTLLAVSCFVISAAAQTTPWKIAGQKLTTTWAEKLDPLNVLPEYPRPQLVRGNWQNLNGLWDYSITPKTVTNPAVYEGKILVPFAVESALSGVGRTVGQDSLLWYKTSFKVNQALSGKKILLHFGAVDWETDVYVNGQKAGSHKGGFDPFSFDISALIKGKGNQELMVRVWDPTDAGPQPRGKQVKRPNGIWYTPVTGIWQTVWLEAVTDAYIESTKQTPDIDKQQLAFSVTVKNPAEGDKILVSAWDGQTKISEKEINPNEETILPVSSPKLWSPGSPFLYDLRISLMRKGKVVDEAKSYFAMRKISYAPDANGVQRMLLNNKFVFQYGPLDQGWWPDGLYTAPSDEALKFDIVETKNMGFNMIRKHIKVEPARWYYYCDREGMLVWQDMPSGDLGNRWEQRPGIIDRATDKDRSPESEGYYRSEWNTIMNTLHNFPSIVVWVPFNEAWGQFKTKEIGEWTMKKDPSRLMNIASGGNFVAVGPIIDLHNYPQPAMPDPGFFGAKQVIVLGEFGGLGLPVDGHTWQNKNNWGYQTFKNADELFTRYSGFMTRLEEMIKLGLSAAVYTQTTDVEIETNGLLTYDRKIFKVPAVKLKDASQKLYNPALVSFK